MSAEEQQRLGVRLTTACKRALPALLLIMSNCAPDAERRVKVERLPSGATRVTNSDGGLWRDGQGWRLIQETALGSVEGTGPEVFGNIADIEVAADGRVFVLERQSNELRIFDASGKHLRTTGGSGSGPGEFVNAFGLEWLPGGDSLLVADGRGNRYSVYDHNGVFVRSTQRPLTSYGYMLRGGFAKGLLYEWGLRLVGQEHEAALIGTRLGTQARAVDTVSFPKPATAPIPVFSVRTERAGMNMGVPFAPSAAWDLAQDATLWWGFGSQYKILQLNLDGDTLREVIVEGISSIPVSGTEIEEFEKSESAKRFRGLGGDLDLTRIPKHKPYFTDLYVDSEGYLWVDVPTADGLTQFDVFDREGQRLGRIATGIRRDAYVKPRVQDAKLYLVGQGELDVPMVFVFRIERTAG